MIYSMTGFGKASTEYADKNIYIEIKALNSKKLDLFTYLPAGYKDKDIDIRKYIKSKLHRGKIELSINVEYVGGGVDTTELNIPLAKKYFKQIKPLGEDLQLNIEKENILNILLRLPNVMITRKDEVDEKEWLKVWEALSKAVGSLNDFRYMEGRSIEQDLLINVNRIEELLGQVSQYEDIRLETIKSRLLEQLANIQIEYDEERFEQELIFYLDKLDINEEKVRLSNHCLYFKETMKEDLLDSGKKLGFIGQEMGREINTLGSKAHHTEIQKLVVQMKNSLEKIKEQVLNVL